MNNLKKCNNIIKALKNVNKHTRWIHDSCKRSSAIILDGRKIADTIQSETKIEVDKWIKKGNKRPKLTVILVGNDPASKIYVRNKKNAADSIGIETDEILVDSSIREELLIDLIDRLNNDNETNGILVQLPLPSHINEQKITHSVAPNKDVDGFHFVNSGKLFQDMQDGLMPCTAMGAIELIKRSGINIFGKRAVVIGRSKNVGLPIALLLQADGKKSRWGLDATVTVCNRNTPRMVLEEAVKISDILVSAAGVPGLINASMVKSGACVIDVGINKIKLGDGKTKIVGDVDYDGVKEVAGYITPVPGGIGPMTIAMLMRNTFIAAKLNSICNRNLLRNY